MPATRFSRWRDDEERVVDPDAQADHRPELRRSRPHVGDRREQQDPGDPDREPEQRGGDRESGHEQRTEGEDQDHDREQEPDLIRRRAARRLGVVDELASERGVDTSGASRLGGLLHVVEGLDAELLDGLVVLERGDRSRATGRRHGPGDLREGPGPPCRDGCVDARLRQAISRNAFPFSLCGTTVAVAPDCWGKRLLSRSIAVCRRSARDR